MKQVTRKIKNPIRILLFCIGAVAVVLIRGMSEPVVTNAADVNEQIKYEQGQIGQIKSRGEVKIGDYFTFNSQDLLNLANKVANHKYFMDGIINDIRECNVAEEEMISLVEKETNSIIFDNTREFDGRGNVQENMNFLNEEISKLKEKGWK